MSAVCERSVQLDAEISWLSRERQDATSAATLSSRVVFLLYRWKAAVTVLVLLSFSFHFCKYDDRVAMSCARVPSNDCQSSAECMMAWSSA